MLPSSVSDSFATEAAFPPGSHRAEAHFAVADSEAERSPRLPDRSMRCESSRGSNAGAEVPNLKSWAQGPRGKLLVFHV